MPAAKPRIGAHTPTTGGMAKRSIEYAVTTGAEVIKELLPGLAFGQLRRQNLV